MEKRWYNKRFQIGLVGGGQLGRMFIQDSIRYDAHVHCLDPDINAPCSELAETFTNGSLQDFDTVYNFGKDKDVVSIEIENVNVEALEKLESEGIPVYPQPSVLRIIRDKGLQKQFYQDKQIPTAPFKLYENETEVRENESGSFVQKLRTGGYDGKGVQVIKDLNANSNLFDAPNVVEQLIPFDKELSVIVARNPKGETATYPTVECEFNPEANLVEFLFSPASISDELEQKAQKLAVDVANAFQIVGLLAVEMFLTKEGELLVNEVAPRPHNSGHQTIEGNYTSQFEQHFRSILDLPLGDTSIVQPAVMINLLGEKGHTGRVHYQGMEEAMSKKGVFVHLYGKSHTKPFRKMGHVTICAPELNEAKKLAREIQNTISVVSFPDV